MFERCHVINPGSSATTIAIPTKVQPASFSQGPTIKPTLMERSKLFSKRINNTKCDLVMHVIGTYPDIITQPSTIFTS